MRCWLLLVVASLACSSGDDGRRVGDPDGDGSAVGDGSAGDPDPGDPTGEPTGDVSPGDPGCPQLPPFDYSCSASDPTTCPEGLCLFGLCIAPLLDPDRWQDCDNQTCDPCETAASCPVDCGAPPAMSGAKAYDNATTLTVELHGWEPVFATEWDTTVYGEIGGPGGVGSDLLAFTPGLPDGRIQPDLPNQAVGIEYFGAVPASYLTLGDLAEIEANPPDTELALHRYALIAAKGIRQRMATAGSTHVNIYCHSMGCHVTRYLLENDIEGLASSNTVVRWTTVAAVLAGARLARLYDNDLVRENGALIGLNSPDFVHMNPDYVTDHTAVWDHQLHAGNNPLLGGVLIHHVVATNPLISREVPFPIVLLDLNNPDTEPNDGIVFSEDEYFQSQNESVRFVSAGGHALPATHSYLHLDHLTVRDHERAGLLMAAALYHSRKVFVKVRSVTLHNDREKDDLLDLTESGMPPAELVVESAVRFNPYVLDTFGRDLVVHERVLDDRTLEIRELDEGVTVDVDLGVFEGPVLDGMTSFELFIRLFEVDRYARYGLAEDLLGTGDVLASETLQIPLVNGTITVSSADITAELEVVVEELY